MSPPTEKLGDVTSAPSPHDGRVLRANRLREDRREQLLESSCAVFERKGYRETTIQDLLEEAAVARGTFYQHFKGKRAVFDALLDGLLEELSGAIVRIDVHSDTPVAIQLKGNVERVFNILWNNAGRSRILLRQAVGLDPDLEEKLHAFDDQVLAMIEGSVRTGMAMGLVRKGPIRLRAAFILGTIKEGIVHGLLRIDSEPMSREDLGRELLDHILGGLLARPLTE